MQSLALTCRHCKKPYILSWDASAGWLRIVEAVDVPCPNCSQVDRQTIAQKWEVKPHAQQNS